MKILIISPHPDDETLGCGGTLFRHRIEDDELYWAIATGISEKYGWSEEDVKKRDVEIKSVAERYGFKDVFKFDYPTTKLNTLSISDLIKKIVDVYRKIEPEIIYMPFAYDTHTDHQLVAKAMNSTFKWFRYPYITKVLMYETPSETEFNFIEKRMFCPNVFIDIEAFLDEKIETMKIYQSEMGEFPFPRSEKIMRALATLRGSQSGFKAAEAFEMVYERR